MNVGQQTSSLNSTRLIQTTPQLGDNINAIIGNKTNIYQGEGTVNSAQQTEKKNEKSGSKTGRNYNFQGKRIVGMEEGKSLRERERFIREQFSQLSS